MTALLRRLLGRTPLGWLQLVRNRGRFFIAIAGVGFAVVLIFMQLGFLAMLLETSVLVHRSLDADVVLVSPAARDLNNLGTVPRRRLYQALEVPGCADGGALYVAYEDWRNPQAPQKTAMLVLGVRPDFHAFQAGPIADQLYKLRTPNAVLLDRASRGTYAKVVAATAAGARPTTEIAGTTVTIVGLIRIGASFATDGSLVTSDETFLRLFPGRQPGVMSVGLIKARPGVDAQDLARRVRAHIPASDARVMTMPEFIQFEQDYEQKIAPIGFVFLFGTAMGILVGAVIVFQILSSDVADHLAEYATFKAMGFTNTALAGIVVEESAILAWFGYVPGFGIALALYEVVRRAIAMPIQMPASRIIIVFVLAFAMCLCSGLLAMRRLRHADPAEIF